MRLNRYLLAALYASFWLGASLWLWAEPAAAQSADDLPDFNWQPEPEPAVPADPERDALFRSHVALLESQLRRDRVCEVLGARDRQCLDLQSEARDRERDYVSALWRYRARAAPEAPLAAELWRPL